MEQFNWEAVENMMSITELIQPARGEEGGGGGRFSKTGRFCPGDSRVA